MLRPSLFSEQSLFNRLRYFADDRLVGYVLGGCNDAEIVWNINIAPVGVMIAHDIGEDSSVRL